MIANPIHLNFPDPEGAEPVSVQPQYCTISIQARLKTLIDQYLSPDHLDAHLVDLPRQFQQPCTRPWPRLAWSEIDSAQIISIDPQVFMAILAGAAETEEPIRGYTQTSRQYLEPLYPQMARFVGGVVDAGGQLVELGLWEQEERRHTPALRRLYTQLSGRQLNWVEHQPRAYHASANPHQDLYHHGLHRIATEYGATCLYMWLMAHTTGALQTVLEELLLDEINHMTKFWGFGRWAFPRAGIFTVGQTLGQSALKKLWLGHGQSSLLHTLRRMTQVLHWQAWSLSNKTTFTWTALLALARLYRWSHNLVPADLQDLFGEHPGYS
jgi:hypothetical protein